jgi:hypothetical protein
MNKPKNIHYLKDDWTGVRGKIRSAYFFKARESLSNSNKDSSWIGASSMVYGRCYPNKSQTEDGSINFIEKQNRWWSYKEPMHPEVLTIKEGEELREIIANMQESNRHIESNGEVVIVNVAWSVEPT